MLGAGGGAGGGWRGGGGLEGGWGDERSADKLVSCLGGFLISAPPGPLLPFRSVFHLLLTSSSSDRKSKKNVLIIREKIYESPPKLENVATFEEYEVKSRGGWSVIGE